MLCVCVVACCCALPGYLPHPFVTESLLNNMKAAWVESIVYVSEANVWEVPAQYYRCGLQQWTDLRYKPPCNNLRATL